MPSLLSTEHIFFQLFHIPNNKNAKQRCCHRDVSYCFQITILSRTAFLIAQKSKTIFWIHPVRSHALNNVFKLQWPLKNLLLNIWKTLIWFLTKLLVAKTLSLPTNFIDCYKCSYGHFLYKRISAQCIMNEINCNVAKRSPKYTAFTRRKIRLFLQQLFFNKKKTTL